MVDISDIPGILRRNVIWLLLGPLITVPLALAFLALKTPSYRTGVEVLIEPQGGIQVLANSPGSGLSSLEFQNVELESQSFIVLSAQVAVAAMAVIGRLTPLAVAVVLALSGAIGPIVGQNFGAGRMDRVRQTFINGLVFVGLYVLFVSAVLYLLRTPIANMFGATGEMAALLFLFCGPLALLQFFNGAIFVCNASFNNLGKPIYSTLLNWSRHTIGTWPFALLGAAFFGASGVLIGQAVGGVLFAIAGIFATRRLMVHLTPEPVNDPFFEEKRLHQVTSQRIW
ncbi:putative mate efflux family protein [Roseibium sp. TrichSKD4]|uniref:MATE family efflux transporter n=1 Tax=Roseibium sp. TrichSKD4 TaxID=744980 RepID=UPI0001E563AB|nr:MATE family efflux transporter [Roseibium sp. TrichSKD4]EFO33037.1 putative mate efflux family protein [Roseibium sp. TrichSKD4]